MNNLKNQIKVFFDRETFAANYKIRTANDFHTPFPSMQLK